MYPTNRKQCVTIGQSISQILDIYNDFSRGYLYLASMQIIIRPLDEDCDSIISWFSLKKKKKKGRQTQKNFRQSEYVQKHNHKFRPKRHHYKMW